MIRESYERPEAEVLELSLGSALLQLSFEGEDSNPITE